MIFKSFSTAYGKTCCLNCILTFEGLNLILKVYETIILRKLPNSKISELYFSFGIGQNRLRLFFLLYASLQIPVTRTKMSIDLKHFWNRRSYRFWIVTQKISIISNKTPSPADCKKNGAVLRSKKSFSGKTKTKETSL